MDQDESYKTTSPVTVIIAWVIVGIPLLWGVYQTLIKSVALFK